MGYKIVLLPIQVPLGSNCFGKIENSDEWETCQYFDNEGGYPSCSLKISYFLKYKNNGNGVPKPKECLDLLEKTDEKILRCILALAGESGKNRRES